MYMPVVGVTSKRVWLGLAQTLTLTLTKDVAAGDELTYMRLNGGNPPADSRHNCRCGEEGCSGVY